jgi:hypothetical protein
VRKRAQAQIGDSTKAANFEEVHQALREARDVSAKAVDNAYTKVAAMDAFADAKPVRAVARTARTRLVESGADLEKMPEVKQVLKDLEGVLYQEVGTGAPRAIPARRVVAVGSPRTGGKVIVDPVTMRLRELNILRNRIASRIKGDGNRTPFSAQDRALQSVGKDLDNAIDDMFVRGSISGDPKAHAAWKAAKELSEKHTQTFDADRTFRNMLLDDATPETVYRLMVGSTSMNARPQAAALVNRMKDVLGENHPAMVVTRNAVLRDVLMPVLEDKANYARLVDNIDKLLLNNKSLVDSLDLPVAELRRLRRASHAAQYVVNMSPEKFSAEYVTGVISSVVVGHSIARKGAMVRTARKLLNRWLGVGLMSRKEIANHLLEGDYDVPIREFSNPSLTNWLQMTAPAAASSPENGE